MKALILFSLLAAVCFSTQVERCHQRCDTDADCTYIPLECCQENCGVPINKHYKDNYQSPDCSAVRCKSPQCDSNVFSVGCSAAGRCEIVKATPEPCDCADGSSFVNCLVDPCLLAPGCPAFPNAVCKADYCGGCNYDYYVDHKIVDCTVAEPVNCTWDEWSDWCECSKDCGCGVQSRTRKIKTPCQNGGAECEGPDTETRECNVQPCAVNCTLNEWSEWSLCSVKCGGGSQKRTRTKNDALNGGADCIGDLVESRECNVAPCAVACTWNEWTEFGPCSVECGGGKKTRSRTQNPPLHGGAPCQGKDTETVKCNTHKCPINCTWNEWTEFCPCPVKCGGGIQERVRTQNPPLYGGAPCQGDSYDSRECNTQPCPINCKWDQWSSWSACPVQCGGGIIKRTRSHKNPAQHGGLECEGDDIEMKKCNTQPCPINCTWNEWSQWSECPVKCGGGLQNRTRTENPEQFGGKDCVGEPIEYQDCNEQPCAVDCEWNAWSEWLPCSKECGGGITNRSRTMDPALHGGAPCEGDATQTKECNDHPCPIDCTWSSWSSWSNCSEECGGGLSNRTRKQTPERHGGAPCKGLAIESKPCNLKECPADCTWNEWSEWCPCSKECGGGVKERVRTSNPAVNGGAPCKGDAVETVPCNAKPCPVPCSWNEWTEFAPCPVKCGGGNTTRTRTMNPPLYGGEECTGEDTETKECNTKPCPIDCTWNEWTEFCPCTAKCGNGTMTRTRTKNPALHGGAECEGDDTETQECNTHECPVDCTWNEWSQFSPCSVKCGYGKSTRTRTKNSALNGGADCVGKDTETKKCKSKDCGKSY